MLRAVCEIVFISAICSYRDCIYLCDLLGFVVVFWSANIETHPYWFPYLLEERRAVYDIYCNTSKTFLKAMNSSYLKMRGVIIPALKLLPAWRLLHLVRPFLSILLEVQTAERKELFKEKLIAVSSQPKWRTCVVKLRGEEPACRLNMKLPGELWSWLRLLLAWKLVYIWNIGEPYFCRPI